jgi:hypothetical protein
VNINEFVVSEYGKELGKEINENQNRIYKRLASELKGKTENQINTLKNTILPRIALYNALIEMNYSKDESFLKVKKYLDQIVGKKMNEQLKKAERIPGFFTIFRKKMYKEVTSNDNWNVEILENAKNVIRYNIKSCLWHAACKENECPELCQIFCDVDHIIYGNMKKVEFIRQGTIGEGQEFCDFCYQRK